MASLSPDAIKALKAHGAPYPQRNAILGEIPTPAVDDPISAIVLAFFLVSAIANMTILQLNNRRGHKFLISGMMFGFSMARITANALRIAWASNLDNVSLSIASQVFTNAGVVVIFIVNLIFAQRILRAYHPKLGWSVPAKVLFRFLFASTAADIIMVIVVIILSFYTLDMSVLLKIRTIQQVGSTWLAFISTVPLFVIAFALLYPRETALDKFGSGRMRTKVRLVLAGSALLAFGAWFRAGIALSPARPVSNPAWYHHKALFYTTTYLIELLVVYTYTFIRIDHRFHVPNGASSRSTYVKPTAATDGNVSDSSSDATVLGDEEAGRREKEEAEEDEIFQ